MINTLNLKSRSTPHCRAQKQRVSVHVNEPDEKAFADKQGTQSSTKRWEFLLLVIDHFHAAVLLNPKLTNNDVVDTTGGVCPGVCFVISAETWKQKGKDKSNMRRLKESKCTHLGSSSVMSPLGSASMLFPQNLSLG